MSYKASSDGSSWSTISIDFTSYSYYASVRAQNLKGWSSWSSTSSKYTPSQSSTSASVSDDDTTAPKINVYWANNVDPTTLATITIYTTGIFSDTVVGTLTSRALNNGSYTM